MATRSQWLLYWKAQIYRGNHTCGGDFPLGSSNELLPFVGYALGPCEGDLMKCDSDLSQGCNGGLSPTSFSIA